MSWGDFVAAALVVLMLALVPALVPTNLAADPLHARAPSGRFRFEPPPPGSYDLPPIDRVLEHELVGPDGAPAQLLDLAPGECALVSFVYLSCADACPLSTATLHELDRVLAMDPELSGRVQLVTVSFDPARDTPEKMAAMEASLAPKSRWRFLTADNREALSPVLSDFGQDAVWIPSPDVSANPTLLRHVLKVFLVDEHRDIRNIYSTGLLDPRLVLNDLRTVLAAGEDGVAGP